MNLEKSSVQHIRYGAGTVVSCEAGFVKVLFPGVGEKQFLYPDAFEHFLKAEDPAVAAQITEEVILKKAEEDALRREREAIQQAVAAAAAAEKKPTRTRTSRTTAGRTTRKKK